jgi:hypothetical protein
VLQPYLKSGTPAICLITPEPDRGEKIIQCDNWSFFTWDCLRGIRKAGTFQSVNEVTDPVEAINFLNSCRDCVLIMHNLHLFLDVPEVVQAIQNGVYQWKSTGCALVTISPSIKLNPELEPFFTVVDLPLPDTEELHVIQKELVKPVNIKPNKAASRAAKGLTEFQAECSYALSIIQTGFVSTKVVSNSKAQMIRKSGLMEFWTPESIKNVGGLGNLKSFIESRKKAFDLDSNMPKPKGVLLVGIPGTGKSLSCKATASILGWPLIRLDIGGLKNSLVGESERRMREATKVIDAFGEAVIWLDEIEKAFAGTKNSGETDGGTSASMFGHFLTWLQETKTPVLVMATANDISKLPPEFIRAGRFDATFFVDLPTPEERREVLIIMNQRYGTDVPLEKADDLNDFTGAEIEQLVKDSLFDGYETALQQLVPLARTMPEEIKNLQKWAKTRARLANTPNAQSSDSRRIRIDTKGGDKD